MTDMEIECFYNLTQTRAQLENRAYIIIETPNGINSISLEVFLNEYRYVYKPLTGPFWADC